MLRPLILVSLAGCILALGMHARSDEQRDRKHPKTNVQVLMRNKLAHAQAVLDGLVTEDYDKIAEAADMMRMIGRAASWQAIDTNRYKTHSKRFASTTAKLATAAQNKNRDGALLQYLQLTTSCVECHDYIRAQQKARDLAPDDSDR